MDTDVASRLHKNSLPPQLAARIAGRRALLTFVTLGELTKWVEVRHWGNTRRQNFSDWVSGFAVLEGDESVATTWGRIAAQAQLRGQTGPQNDSWIAAACLTHDLPLATLKVKDFQRFVDHNGLRLITAE
ncbi:PIN domain-containing protein [Kineosporia sp. NBRC 101731]|uniref:PIN domain-containing protein n=1 Tax=Kineosporia sp. NBRC 101731 TaxID=3032199 RepID=UPI0025549E53|nr:PIN domain-containing protein [Kineosporia sp. NBRC 101731]